MANNTPHRHVGPGTYQSTQQVEFVRLYNTVPLKYAIRISGNPELPRFSPVRALPGSHLLGPAASVFGRSRF